MISKCINKNKTKQKDNSKDYAKHPWATNEKKKVVFGLISAECFIVNTVFLF